MNKEEQQELEKLVDSLLVNNTFKIESSEVGTAFSRLYEAQILVDTLSQVYPTETNRLKELIKLSQLEGAKANPLKYTIKSSTKDEYGTTWFIEEFGNLKEEE